jgi:hypothetical protein
MASGWLGRRTNIGKEQRGESVHKVHSTVSKHLEVGILVLKGPPAIGETDASAVATKSGNR